jgi:hypothetical protein
LKENIGREIHEYPRIFAILSFYQRAVKG